MATVGDEPLTAPFTGTEGGGGATNTGGAWLWTAPDGSQPHAREIFSRGHLSNATHAVVDVEPGSYHVFVDETRSEGQCIGVARLEPTGRLKLVALSERDEWLLNEDVPDAVAEAVAVCVRKARTYHCREAMYVA